MYFFVLGDELDIRSCVQLLLDLFTQFVSPSPEIATPPALLCQVMRSVKFIEESNLRRLIDTFLIVDGCCYGRFGSSTPL